MRRAYFKALYLFYMLAILLCVGSRCVLVLRFVNPETGLYDGGEPLTLLFNLTLLACIVLWFAMTLLRRTRHEYPLAHRSRAVRVFSALCGLALLACMAANAAEVLNRWRYGAVPAGLFSSYLYYEPSAVTFLLLGLKLLFGVLGGASLLLFAFLRAPGRLAFLGVFPALWQLTTLLERFTGYLAPTQISDNLLTVLFMTMAPLFLLGQARSVGGIGMPSSRTYLIPAGFAASLAGFSLIVPKLLLFIVSRQPVEFTFSWTLMSYVYMLLLSVYAIVFLAGYTKAIKIV
jgi:hypothetical protein